MKLSRIIAKAEKLGKHWSLSIENETGLLFRADTTDGEGDAFGQVQALDPAALEALDKAKPDYSLVVKDWTAVLNVQIGDTLFFDRRRYKLPARLCEIGF